MDPGMSIGEVWELVKLLNRELKNTRLNLDASEQENKKLRDENNELRTQGRGLSVLSSDHDAADVKFTPCIRGLCNSADEVRTLARLKNELEVELASCRSALQEKTSSLEDLRQKVNDLNHQYHVSTEELSALRQECANLKQQLPDQRSGAGERGPSTLTYPVHQNGMLIPHELLPILAHYPLPDTSSRPESQPCLAPSSADPTRKIPKAILDSCYPYHPFYCDIKMLWCSKPLQHAFFLLPSFLYNPFAAKDWTKNPDIDSFLGSSHEMFYAMYDKVESKRTGICYAGTYTFRFVGSLTPKEFKQCPQILRRTLCRETISFDPRSLGQKEYGAHMSKASNPYYTGQQQISFIFMECIGFNKELYAALRQKYRDYLAKEASKRPADVDLDPRGKKKRAE